MKKIILTPIDEASEYLEDDVGIEETVGVPFDLTACLAVGAAVLGALAVFSFIWKKLH